MYIKIRVFCTMLVNKYYSNYDTLQRTIIRIILIHKLDTKHSNFDIDISLEIYYVSIRKYSLGYFGEVREGCGWF